MQFDGDKIVSMTTRWQAGLAMKDLGWPVPSSGGQPAPVPARRWPPRQSPERAESGTARAVTLEAGVFSSGAYFVQPACGGL
jgi:hypothetical protein